MNWNKYHSKKRQGQNGHLDFLIDVCFQAVNRHFVLSFNDDDGRKSYKQYYLPTVEIEDFNFKIDGTRVPNK